MQVFDRQVQSESRLDANQGVTNSIPGSNVRLASFQHSLSSGILHKGLSGDSTVPITECAMTLNVT